MPNIVERRYWDATSVMSVCIKYNFYTRGNSSEYQSMLIRVLNSEPTVEVLYDFASDILKHSREDLNLTNVMFILANEAVTLMYHEVEDDKNAK